MSDTKQAALQYAKRGWKVFPLQAGTKDAPLCKWRDKSTDVKALVSDQFRNGANVGLDCGKSGLVVIDLDVKKGHAGPQSWERLKAELSIDDSDALVQTTPSGGVHHIFRDTTGGDIGNNAGRLGNGIDVRANGGYILLAPSQAGGDYAQLGNWEREPGPIPAAVVALLATEDPKEPTGTLGIAPPNGSTAYGAGGLKDELAALSTAPEGQRNDQLNRSAFALGQLAAGGELDRLETLQALRGQALSIGLTPTEVDKTLDSAFGAGEKTPRTAQNPPRLPHKLGAKIPKQVAKAIKAIRFDPPAPDLRAAVAEALAEKDPENTRRLRPAESRRETASDVVCSWLIENGDFCQTENEELFYFSRDSRRLYDLAAVTWAAYLYALTGVNPASTHFAHIAASCKTEAIYSERRQVVRMAQWDSEAQVLRVSRFDGTVYVLDGETITEEGNGERVLFADNPLWLPYTPDYTTTGGLAWLTSGIPNWESAPQLCSLAFRVWSLSTFFTELCPSRPLCVFMGEKGSGKSMALRLLLKFLFGPSAELSGIPDRPDGFTAAASSSHVLVLDNLDVFTGWLRDKLARLATGAEDSYRKLYTSNELGRVLYRCWLGFTSRTPDTLRRDDLADRLLILPVKRLGDDKRQGENTFYEQATNRRDAWWGEVLTVCNRAVASIRAGDLGTSTSRLRLADWEALGRVLARNEGQEDIWNAFCESLQQTQADFLLEGDPIVDALTMWLRQTNIDSGEPMNYDRWMTGRELYNELTEALYPGKKPDRDWPKSARSFGMRLAQIRRDLNSLFDLEWEKGTTKANANVLVYRFGQKK